jgi:hypothetical protein
MKVRTNENTGRKVVRSLIGPPFYLQLQQEAMDRRAQEELLSKKSRNSRRTPRQNKKGSVACMARGNPPVFRNQASTLTACNNPVSFSQLPKSAAAGHASRGKIILDLNFAPLVAKKASNPSVAEKSQVLESKINSTDRSMKFGEFSGQMTS